MTPLMIAAKTNSVFAIDYLLDPSILNGKLNDKADPNKTVDGRGEESSFTVLTYAILSESLEIALKVIESTKEYLNVSLEKLAESQIDWEQNVKIFEELKQIIREAVKIIKRNILRQSVKGLVGSSF